MVATLPMVPLPRQPLDPGGRTRHWYENELGWATVPGAPVRFAVGHRFDVLDVPLEAGRAALRHLAPGSPVAVQGDRMRLLVAAGSAEELPGLLQWLEWGALDLDLVALGAGALMDAPPPPAARQVEAQLPGTRQAEPQPLPAAAEAQALFSGTRQAEAQALVPGARQAGARPLTSVRRGSQGAPVWLRPPEPGREVKASLATLSAVGGHGGAPDLVRLVDTVATRCHRIRLRRGCAQPLALSW